MEVEAPELRISSGRVAYRPDEEEEEQVVGEDFEPKMAEPEEPLIRLD